LKSAKSLREDFLQQNAFVDADAYTTLQKQFQMLRVILRFYTLSKEALASGVYLKELLELPIRERLGRIKEISEDELKEFDGIYHDMKQEIYQLIEERGEK
jgi:V/A-type H+-transporting ATPase subunit A